MNPLKIVTKNPMLFVLLIGMALRLYQLDSRGLYADETFSIFTSAKDVSSMMAAILREVIQAPLYYLVLKVWLVMGRELFILRFPSLVFGIFSIVGMYLFGCRLFNRTVGLIAASLLALAPFHLWYSQNLRMYTMTTMLTLFSLYFWVKALREKGKTFWLVYFVLTLLNIYTHYFALLVVLVENLYVFLQRNKYARVRNRWIGVQIILGLGVLLWVLALVLFANVQPGYSAIVFVPVSPTFLAVTAASAFYAFVLGNLYPSVGNGWLILFSAVLFGVAFILGLRRVWQNKTLAIFVLGYLFLPIFLAILVIPGHAAARYLVLFSPALYLILAAGVSFLQSRMARWVLFILISVASLASVLIYYGDDYDYGLRAGSEYIASHMQPNDVILHTKGQSLSSFLYYLPAREEYAVGAEGFLSAVDQGGDFSGVRTMSEVAQKARANQIWVVGYYLVATRRAVSDAFADLGAPSVPPAEFKSAHDLGWLDDWLTDNDYTLVEQRDYPSHHHVTLFRFARTNSISN